MHIGHRFDIGGHPLLAPWEVDVGKASADYERTNRRGVTEFTPGR
jgi:hypothetical protein